MNPNPFSGLFHSRKFWLLILDTFVSILSLVLTRFLAPDELDFVLKIIAILQPVFITVILGITAEDNAKVKAQASVEESKVYGELSKNCDG